jgi:hypothetical protein
MNYFLFNSFGHIVGIAETLTPEQRADRAWECRADDWTLVRAQRIAAEASSLTGAEWDAIDNGEHCYPRYDVVRVPRVGDKVSYAFNGDSYPDGEIVSVSSRDKGFRIVKTDTGSAYYRRKQTAGWIKKGGTWSLIQGHQRRWNPEF